MTATYLSGKGLCIDTPAGRPLVRELTFSLERERVALIGRNGVGKSTLLRVLAGEHPPTEGSLVSHVESVLVRQEPREDEVERAREWLASRAGVDRAVDRDLAWLRLSLEPGPRSRGQARKLALLAAKHGSAQLLLLDEPTEDLDEAGIGWLQRWLGREQRGALIVTHHRGLLRCVSEFFLVTESGCRHLSGSFDEIQRELELEQQQKQEDYVRQINILTERERHHERVLRRRARKKNVGRLHELRRCTSRCRLNEKRSYAQESQARAAKIREQRIEAVRGWAKATRRALTVELPLHLRRPSLPPHDGVPLVRLEQVGMTIGERSLFEGLDLQVGRERVAIVGPNGAGKTTLLQLMLGRRQPSSGKASCRIDRIGSIDQGAQDWLSDDSLLAHLAQQAPPETGFDELAARVVAQQFPLALAERPLRSLSPGERVRAALICLFQQTPQIELLVLDEPSYALDFVGVAALERALRSWPGGLIVVSHDRELLDAIGIDHWIELDGHSARHVCETTMKESIMKTKTKLKAGPRWWQT